MAGYNSNGVFTAGICEKILTTLESTANIHNVPSMRRSYLGYLDAVRSPINTEGTVQIPVQNDTKHKQVRIRYSQRTVESEVTTSEDGNCTPERYPDFLETTFDVDSVVSYNFGLKKREVSLICNEGNTEILQMYLRQSFDAMARVINRALLGKQLLNFGFNYGNSPASAASKSVSLLTAATGAPLALGIQTIKQDFYEKNQYAGIPMVIGQGNLMKYIETLKAGCCNTTGTDMLALANSLGWAPFLDTMMEGVFGTDQFMTMAPGMVQFVPFLRYVGENAGQFGTSVDTTLTDPVTGLTYDMKVDYDGCNEAYYVRLTLNYGLWINPLDTFNPADPLYRTNGTTRYTGNAV